MNGDAGRYINGQGEGEVDVLKILEAVSSPIRLNILRILSFNDLGYTELMKAINMHKTSDAGKFAYHLKRLLRTGLVEVDKESKFYRLSNLGRTILSMIDSMISKASRHESLLVRRSDMLSESFDKLRIVDSLVREVNISPKLAYKIAINVERKLRALKLEYISGPLIRELVNAELVTAGLEKYRNGYTRVGLPIYDVSQIIKRATATHDPLYAWNSAAEGVFRDYVLLNTLPRQLTELYFSGALDIHSLERWVTHILCLSQRLSINAESSIYSAISHALSGLAVQEVVFTTQMEEIDINQLISKISAMCDPCLKTTISLNLPSATLMKNQTLTEYLPFKGDRLNELHRLINSSKFNTAISINNKGFAALTSRGTDHSLYLTTGLINTEKSLRGIIAGLIGINVVKALLESKRDIDLLSNRLRDFLRAVQAIFIKKQKFLERFKQKRPDDVIHFLIAPVGLYEAVKLISDNKSSKEITVVYSQLLETITEEVASIHVDDGHISLASTWPTKFSSRMTRIDANTFGAKEINSVLHCSGGNEYYIDRVAPQSLLLDASLCKQISNFFASGVIIDFQSDVLDGENGMRALQQLLNLSENIIIRLRS